MEKQTTNQVIEGAEQYVAFSLEALDMAICDCRGEMLKADAANDAEEVAANERVIAFLLAFAERQRNHLAAFKRAHARQ